MAQQGPLSGFTIIDLSRILAGPYCTLLLAELGARAIKVEPLYRGRRSEGEGTGLGLSITL